MQSPTSRTPIARCLELAYYTSRMLGKFPDRPALLDSARRLDDGAAALAGANQAYLTARRTLLEARVDVGFADFSADLTVRRSHKQVEIVDGHRNGRVAAQIFPGGYGKIIRQAGPSQVASMRNLEARLQAAQDIWPGANAELSAVAASRASYQTALDSRQAAAQKLNDLRAARDAAHERFVHLYSEVISRVKLEFPRNATVQELFFDIVYHRASPTRAPGADEPGEPGEPGEPDEPAESDVEAAEPAAASG